MLLIKRDMRKGLTFLPPPQGNVFFLPRCCWQGLTVWPFARKTPEPQGLMWDLLQPAALFSPSSPLQQIFFLGVEIPTSTLKHLLLLLKLKISSSPPARLIPIKTSSKVTHLTGKLIIFDKFCMRKKSVVATKPTAKRSTTNVAKIWPRLERHSSATKD